MEKEKEISILEIENVNDLYLCGDIHGEFPKLVANLDDHGIKNSAIVVLGDCGFGFENSGHYPHLYQKKLKKKLDKQNNIILCIRGNHDDPRFFDDPEFIPDIPRIRTLPSNTILKIKGYNILCIGGAISVDRKDRIKENTKIKPGHPKCYWPEEKINYINDIENIGCRVDVVLSHTAPISFDPPLLRNSEMDEALWEDILESRNYLEKINSRVKPGKWFFGHFHKSLSSSTGSTVWRCLDCHEIVLVPEKNKDILGSI